MLLTIQTTVKPKQICFEDILKNPFLDPSQLKPSKSKRVTVEITEEQGQNLYDKRFPKNIENNYKTVNEIKRKDIAKHYDFFTIPKRSNPNKRRKIYAPDAELRGIQEYLLYFMKETKVLPHNAAHAYVEKRGTITAMKTHQINKSNWFLQLDLKDFFPSFNKAFITRALSQVYPFAFMPEDFIEYLTKYALLNNSMPQGTVLSPYLSNMCMVPIDYTIQKTLQEKYEEYFVYTRYADDMTISSRKQFDKDEIVQEVRNALERNKAPFRINEEKTHFGTTAGRNYHLGLIINNRNELSVGHEQNQKFRAMLHQFCINNPIEEKEDKGETWTVHDIQKMLGLISYYRGIEPKFINTQIARYNEKFNMDIETRAKDLINLVYNN